MPVRPEIAAAERARGLLVVVVVVVAVVGRRVAALLRRLEVLERFVELWALWGGHAASRLLGVARGEGGALRRERQRRVWHVVDGGGIPLVHGRLLAQITHVSGLALIASLRGLGSRGSRQQSRGLRRSEARPRLGARDVRRVAEGLGQRVALAQIDLAQVFLVEGKRVARVEQRATVERNGLALDDLPPRRLARPQRALLLRLHPDFKFQIYNHTHSLTNRFLHPDNLPSHNPHPLIIFSYPPLMRVVFFLSVENYY